MEAPSRPKQERRLHDQPLAEALVHVQASLEAGHGQAPQRAQRAGGRCGPGADGGGQPGSSAKGMATASSSSSARPPRPEPRTMPEPRSQLGLGADRGLELVEADG